MLSFEKISSKSSGSYNSSSRNVVEFTIPDSQVYDLSKSQIAFTTTITATPAAGEPADAIHNVSLKYAPQCLVKNCSLSTSRTGTVEDIQNVNVINTNLSFLNDSHSVLEYQPVLNGTNYVNEYGNNLSIFRSLQHTKASSDREPQLTINLSDLFGVGGFRRYPSYMVGETTIRLELETDSKCLQEVHAYEQGGAVLGCDDVGVGDDRDKVITSLDFDSHSDCGLWVGEPIEISYITGGNPGTHKAKITTLTRPAGNAQKTTVKFEPNIVAGDLTQVDITELSASSLAYEITEANLNMVAVSSPLSSKAQNELSKGVDFGFQSWEQEADNMTAIPYYDRNFYVAPNVEAVCMCSVDTDLKTSLTDLDSYRTSINGVDTTSEPVQPKGTLQKYKAMATVPSLGAQVRRLDDIPDMVVERMPPSKGLKQVQVRIKATSGNNLPARQVHLFKRVNRVLSVSAKTVQVQ